MHRMSYSATLLIIFILCATAAISGNLQDKIQRKYRYLIPSDYIGWVRIDFNVKDAPALPLEDGYYVLNIPATGRLQTSTQDEGGFIDAEYYYVCNQKRHRLAVTQTKPTCKIWGEFQGPGSVTEATPYKYRYVFVGPEADYRKYQFSGENLHNLELEDDGYPKVGTKSITSCEEPSSLSQH